MISSNIVIRDMNEEFKVVFVDSCQFPLKVSLFQRGIQEVMKLYSSEVLESMKKHQRGNNRQDIFRLLGKVVGSSIELEIVTAEETSDIGKAPFSFK